MVLREVVGKVAQWIDRFKAVGDSAIQYDTAHAALPWAAFRFLLNVAMGDLRAFASTVTALEKISCLAYRCRIRENLYLQRQSTHASHLNGAMIRLYSSMLVWLSKAVSYFKKPKGGKISTTVRNFILGNCN